MRSGFFVLRHSQRWGRAIAAAIPLVITFAMLPPHAAAQLDEPARFEYRIGGQAFSEFTSRVRLDSPNRGLGTQIRLEDDVNLEERVSVARIDGFYNFNRRHYIWFAAYDVEREGTRDIVREIRFGEQTFTFATTVSATVEETVAKVAYGFNALSRPRATLGPSFGLHVMRLEAALSALGTSRVQEAATTAPLPVFGIRGNYQIANRWRLEGAFQWFDLDIGDIDGLFTDVTLSVEHDTFERFGFGIGINNNLLDVESGDDDFRGRVDLSFSSVLVYFKGSVGPAR